MGIWIILFSTALTAAIFIIGGKFSSTHLFSSSRTEAAAWGVTIILTLLIFVGGLVIGANYKDSYQITSVQEFYSDEGETYFEVYCQFRDCRYKLMLSKAEFHSLLSEDGKSLKLSTEELDDNSYFSIRL